METNRLLSFLFSLCLHLAVFILALFMPAPARIPLELPSPTLVSGLVTIGKEGKNMPGARQETPQARRGRQDDAAEQPPPKPAENARDKAETAPPKPPEPEVKPEVKPKPMETPKPPPVDPKATPIAREPEKQQRTEPTAPETKKPETKKPEEKKPEEKKNEPRNVSSAMAELRKQAGSRRGSAQGQATGPGSGQELSSALAELGRRVGSSGMDESGTGPGGRGGDGMGRLGAYQDSVISRVRPNWSFVERADRKNYIAVVNILIDSEGLIKGARIVTPSGNSYFDGTVMQAIAATERLEPPPDPDMMNINISFTPQALAR